VQGLWALDQDFNAWAYFDGGVGWQKITADSDNIFFNILTQLIAAKAAGKAGELLRVQGVIKQVYAL
jgi:hypothetical protein